MMALCGKVFTSLRALEAHQQFTIGGQHGIRDKLNRLTLTNQCMFCSSVFASRLVAMSHVSRAYRQGRCMVDRAVFDHELVEPELKCPECEYEAPCLSVLQQHIVMHVPGAAEFHEIHV